jgi:hypothetical protein
MFADKYKLKREQINRKEESKRKTEKTKSRLRKEKKATVKPIDAFRTFEIEDKNKLK